MIYEDFQSYCSDKLISKLDDWFRVLLNGNTYDDYVLFERMPAVRFMGVDETGLELKEELKIFSIIGTIALAFVINGVFIIIGGIVISLSILVSLSSGKRLKEVLDIKKDFQKYKLFVEKHKIFLINYIISIQKKPCHLE